MPKIPKDIPTLWYENSDGVRWLPDFNDPGGSPEGFVYQRSRFPRDLHDSALRIVTQEEVNACNHPDVVPTGGWIDGYEGQECRVCRGMRSREVTQPWGPFQGGRSVPVAGGTQSGPVALMLAMSRPTLKERLKSLWRTWRWVPQHSLDNAILAACVSCEKCMNILLWEYGCNDGYPEGSVEAQRCGTSCELCDPPVYSDAQPTPPVPPVEPVPEIPTPEVEPEPAPPGPSIWERLEPQSTDDVGHLCRRHRMTGAIVPDDPRRLAVDHLP
jgi:hypothetical protein